jgi:hypothetical protein
MPTTPRRPAWLPLLLALWWTACPTPLRCEPKQMPPLPEVSPPSMICLTQLELDTLQDAVKAEVAKTAKEAADAAVKAAVAPLLADLAGERAKAAGWEREFRTKATEALVAEICAVVLAVLAAAGWGLAALK